MFVHVSDREEGSVLWCGSSGYVCLYDESDDQPLRPAR